MKDVLFNNLNSILGFVLSLYFHRSVNFQKACWACAVFPIVCIDSFATNFAVKRCVIFQAFNKNSLKRNKNFNSILKLI